jgi:hypothetical protein
MTLQPRNIDVDGPQRVLRARLSAKHFRMTAFDAWAVLHVGLEA